MVALTFTYFSYLPDQKSTRLWLVARFQGKVGGQVWVAEYWYFVSKQQEMKQLESDDLISCLSVFVWVTNHNVNVFFDDNVVEIGSVVGNPLTLFIKKKLNFFRPVSAPFVPVTGE